MILWYEQRFLVGSFSLDELCLVKCWRRHLGGCAEACVGKHEKTRQNADPTEAPNAGRVGKIENYVVSVGARRQIKTQEPSVGGHCNGVGKT